MSDPRWCDEHEREFIAHNGIPAREGVEALLSHALAADERIAGLEKENQKLAYQNGLLQSSLIRLFGVINNHRGKVPAAVLSVTSTAEMNYLNMDLASEAFAQSTPPGKAGG